MVFMVLGWVCATIIVTKRSKYFNTKLNFKNFYLNELFSETRKYEVGIVSNRRSPRYGE
jgi:hypothetical protein